MFTIRSNLPSTVAQRNQANASRSLAATAQKLTSGYRVSRAYDDAAALAVGTGLNADIRSFQQSARNALGGRSLLDTAQGALGQSSELLTRIRELAVQSGNGSLDASARDAIAAEVGSLAAEVQRLAETTESGGKKLLDGSVDALEFQVGTQDADGAAISVELEDAGLGALGLADLASDPASALATGDVLARVDAALASVASQRASLGAADNRLSSAMMSAETGAMEAAAAKGRLMDADMAYESAERSKAGVLEKAGVAVQVQASRFSRQALQLLEPS